MSGIKGGGVAILLALVLACVPASSARAQQDQSAPVRPGTVAIRVANMTGCPMAIRAKVNGVTKYLAAIDTNAVRRLDARPDTNALEVEILATPKLCGVAIPESSQPASAPPAPPVRPIQRARYEQHSRYEQGSRYHHFPIRSPFARS